MCVKLCFFIFICITTHLAYAEPITVPPFSAAGKCAPAPTKYVSFAASAASPGVQGIYAMPKSQYDKLAAVTDGNGTDTAFNYFTELSCVGAGSSLVTSCKKTTEGLNVTDAADICVAFINEGATSISGDLAVDFTEKVVASSSAGTIMIAVGGAIAGLVLLILTITGYRQYKQRLLANKPVPTSNPEAVIEKPVKGPLPISQQYEEVEEIVEERVPEEFAYPQPVHSDTHMYAQFPIQQASGYHSPPQVPGYHSPPQGPIHSPTHSFPGSYFPGDPSVTGYPQSPGFHIPQQGIPQQGIPQQGGPQQGVHQQGPQGFYPPPPNYGSY